MVDAATELEEEQRIRMEEIHFLQNICAALPDEQQQNRMRRAMVVMLYSHFEGYAQFTFEVYRRAIENSQSKCCEVHPSLATAALNDIFKAIRNPDKGVNLLPDAMRTLGELRPLAIERAFVEKAWDFGQRIATVPEEFVDMESNLKPIVLRKNLYRLGLPHDLFDELEGSINKLLNYRNNIAHGSKTSGVDEVEYNELLQAVIRIMDELKKTILTAITTEAFRLPASQPA